MNPNGITEEKQRKSYKINDFAVFHFCTRGTKVNSKTAPKTAPKGKTAPKTAPKMATINWTLGTMRKDGSIPVFIKISHKDVRKKM